MSCNYEVKTKFLRGFADKTRLQILDCIKEEEKAVSQIVKEINGNQSNISQHLSCLKGCGIITGRQEGRNVYYSIRNEETRQLLAMFDIVLNQVEQDVACCEINKRLLPGEKVKENV
ncbi:metalloregulator ArsR/SmtB family transcription factor [Bacillus aerolatus]|uniref:Metalloregulator ArsR/SmtB family transcription factor n=1 Tax=Bacillus aerolatus TaxID=2653354 RepID=A0A6I1FG62_9BACI|nr:metalloregulator ArsR/SmtB family transcription factor [Bacillus aerolatus]KAB7704369.1 metalloregulator ArsR/SmtB family transcription factor [Bacillus aerolatus]